jgi:outer membrane immunogenic protein
MRFSLLPVAGIVSLLASPSVAQDMGPWTGAYIGLNAGYGFSDSTTQTSGQAAINNSTVSDGARPAAIQTDMNGFMGGGQVGYNWQHGAWVLGIETDIQYSDLAQSQNVVTAGTAFPGTRNNRFNADLDFFGTFRGRIGYTFGDALFYGTGGFAYGGVNHGVNFSGPLPAGVTQFIGGRGQTEAGYTVGAGVEYDIGSGFSAKTEFLHYNLGSSDIPVNVIAGSGGAGTGYNVKFKNFGSLVRVGLNYRL